MGNIHSNTYLSSLKNIILFLDVLAVGEKVEMSVWRCKVRRNEDELATLPCDAEV